MRKLFLDKVDGDVITLTGDDHKHIAYSLRMRKGDEITVCAAGVDYTAIIREMTKNSTTAEITGKARSTAEPDTDITLFFGALKGDKNDYVVQKCTELGVKDFVPFISDFSAVTRESVKTERLARIALEAAKQSGRGVVPPVQNVVGFNDLSDFLNGYDTIVFPYEQEEELPLDKFLSGCAKGKTAIVIGPEGGFSKKEAEEIRSIAGGSVTLGERILRADTACVSVVSVVMYAFGEWRRNK